MGRDSLVGGAVVLAALSLFLGCGGAQVTDEGPLAPEIRPTGLVILPVALTIPEGNALEVVGQSLQVTRQLLESTDLPILSVFDFDLNKSPEEAVSPMLDTDLRSRGEEEGSSWREWLALHVMVTESRATMVRDIVDTRIKDPKKPNTFRQYGVEAAVRVRIGLYEPRGGKRLAWTTVEVADDPMNFEPGEDPRPGVTRAIRAAVARLLELAPTLKTGIPARRTRGEGLVDSVLAMSTWKVLDGKSWMDNAPEEQEELRDAKVMALWDRFAPGLAPGDLLRASRNRGLLVRSPLPPLQTGDVVTAVEKQPVVAAHQFDRLVSACSARTNGCQIQIIRAGASQIVALKWPALPAIASPEP